MSSAAPVFLTAFFVVRLTLRPTSFASSAVFAALERGTRKGAGIGLGLFIVREIIRAHGGTISVDSSLDRGTTFAVRLPRNGAETAQRR